MEAAAHVRAVSTPDGASRVASLRGGGPLCLRNIEDVVYMDIAPQSGDDLWLDITIDPGAHLALRGVGGFLTPPDPFGLPSHLTITATVGDGATLDWQPQPTVSVEGSLFRSSTSISLGKGAKLTYVEDICLGLKHKTPGGITSSLQIRRNDQLIVRNTNRLGRDSLDSTSYSAARELRRITTMIRSTDQPIHANPICWHMEAFERSAVASMQLEKLQFDVSVVRRAGAHALSISNN